jgi:hypothetical protein
MLSTGHSSLIEDTEPILAISCCYIIILAITTFSILAGQSAITPAKSQSFRQVIIDTAEAASHYLRYTLLISIRH